MKSLSPVRAILLTLLAPLAGLHAPDASKPNIILVMPDDVGYGDYACLGKLRSWFAVGKAVKIRKLKVSGEQTAAKL